jgi:molybdate transport repressor ModE-like protein
MPLRFDLVDLRLFIHVVEAGSITHGAQRSNMTLASASERIRAMENTLGSALLIRKRRGVEPTGAGAVLAQHAGSVLQQLEQMRGELGGFSKGLRGRIRLYSNTVGILEYLPATLAKFLSKHPQIDLELEEHPSQEIVRAVAAGRADIGIVAGSVDPTAQLQTFPFARNQLVLIVPSKHPLARHREVSFRQALQHDFVGLGADSALQDYVNQQALRAGLRLRVRLRLGSFDLICQMVGKGIGIAVLPEATARRMQRSMAVKAVPLTDAWTARHLTTCVRSLKALSPHAQQLLKVLQPGTLP